jgi:hypothetical protein
MDEVVWPGGVMRVYINYEIWHFSEDVTADPELLREY